MIEADANAMSATSRARAGVVLALGALVAACGSNEEDTGALGEEPASVPRFVGLVTLEDEVSGGMTGGYAGAIFHESEPASTRAAIDLFAGDDCVIIDFGGSLLGEPIDAGDNLVFGTAEGTFLTLARDEDDEYASEPGLSPLPRGLTLDVSGADFPAIAAVALPDAPPSFDRSADVLAPALGQSVTASTVFEWRALGVPGVLFQILLQDFRPGGMRQIACLALDDGTFSFPADVAAELGPDFSVVREPDTDLDRFGAVRVSTRREGEAIVFATHVTSSDSEPPR